MGCFVVDVFVVFVDVVVEFQFEVQCLGEIWLLEFVVDVDDGEVVVFVVDGLVVEGVDNLVIGMCIYCFECGFWVWCV